MANHEMTRKWQIFKRHFSTVCLEYSHENCFEQFERQILYFRFLFDDKVGKKQESCLWPYLHGLSLYGGCLVQKADFQQKRRDLSSVALLHQTLTIAQKKLRLEKMGKLFRSTTYIRLSASSALSKSNTEKAFLSELSTWCASTVSDCKPPVFLQKQDSTLQLYFCWEINGLMFVLP